MFSADGGRGGSAWNVGMESRQEVGVGAGDGQVLPSCDRPSSGAQFLIRAEEGTDRSSVDLSFPIDSFIDGVVSRPSRAVLLWEAK